MRIGIDAAPLVKEAAGIGQYLINIIENLLLLDQDNEYILYSYDSVTLPFQLNERWQIKIYGKNKKTSEFLTKLPRQIKQDQLDLFWSPRGYLPPGNKKVRYLITVHDLSPLRFTEFFDFKHRTFFRLFITMGIKKANKIITISKSSQKDISSTFQIALDKITVTYLGANVLFNHYKNTDAIHHTLTKHNIVGEYILCLSTIEPRKNMLRTIKAFHKGLINKQITNKLVIVGGSGWKNNDIYDYVKEHKLDDDIIFTGYVPIEDIKNIYNGSSLFVYVSLYEGFGIPILEAMQSGIPVITSDNSSMPEVADNACLLINPREEDEILAAMIQVLNSETLQNEMISNGLAQSKLFSWKKCTEETLEIINQLTRIN